MLGDTVWEVLVEIRNEKELDAAIALARLSKTERLLRQARGHTRLRSWQAAVLLTLVGLAGALLVRGVMAGDLLLMGVLPWLSLLYALALHFSQRINAVVDLLELGMSHEAEEETAEEPGASENSDL